ncbi:hypothetical protein CBR_g8945 [Chara braunii]|uniref:Reverse transcriptase/retrotransposon-derived protein RNase H-like domain-containing protein n=1 Tax=Chara braunii TaxID=69332 RepID=A0A388KNB6_CHABU|nr:hypothetical protein CBR_g8945 [Chara braunii]|eukprot:GBG71527.1 hypothetical protein CBR_g8945 [Chara braunii]
MLRSMLFRTMLRTMLRTMDFAASKILFWNRWHYVTGTYDGRFIRVYVDGVEGRKTALQDAQLDHDGYLSIGGAEFDPFAGVIDELRLWNKACTEEEVRQHMVRPLEGGEEGLVGYWKFDEGGGHTAYDFTSFRNHAVLGYGRRRPRWNASSAPVLVHCAVSEGKPSEIRLGGIAEAGVEPVPFVVSTPTIGKLYRVLEGLGAKVAITRSQIPLYIPSFTVLFAPPNRASMMKGEQACAIFEFKVHDGSRPSSFSSQVMIDCVANASQCASPASPPMGPSSCWGLRTKEKSPAAILKERKEKKEAKKQALLEAHAAKKKKLEEEMEKLKKEEEEKLKEVEEEEEEEEIPLVRTVRRKERGESSGVSEDEKKLENMVSEWVANLSLGEDEEALMYIPQDKRDVVMAEIKVLTDPLEQQAVEEEKILEWKLRLRRQRRRRISPATDLEKELVAAAEQHTNALTQGDLQSKVDAIAKSIDVLWKLREANFKINAKKCEWAKTHVLYMGHVLDGDGIKLEDSKIVAIRDWPTPCTLTELRSFLGLANYYRKFVRNFSTIAASLRRLLKKEAIRKWDKDCTSALKKLKRALIEYPVLKVADPSLPFVVTTDASQYGIGDVLQQDDGNGYRPVEFMSARMPSEKVATSTYQRELYALRQALEHWRHFLLGRHFKCIHTTRREGG